METRKERGKKNEIFTSMVLERGMSDMKMRPDHSVTPEGYIKVQKRKNRIKKKKII